MSVETVVMKFGGSSVADLEKVKEVAQIIEQRKKNMSVVVVVSAMGKTTNSLIDKAYQLSERPNLREMDMLVATGEIVSASLLSICLNEMSVPAVSLTGFQAGFNSYGKHGSNKIEDVDVTRLKRHLDDEQIVVVTGFQGMNPEGDITTLGRGGSDTSAVAIAAKLGAKCEIYTDVDGIYSADPRIHKGAKKIDAVTYEELMEMAHLGANVIEPRSVEIAERYGVEMEIRLNDGVTTGTRVVGGKDMEKTTLTNVSKLDEVLLVSMSDKTGSSAKITECFLELAKKNVNIDIISQTIVNGQTEISFTSTEESKHEIADVLESKDIDYRMKTDVSKVSIVGTAMRNQVGIAAKVFEIFLEEDIRFYEISTSEISISYVVDTENTTRVIELLADAFNI